MNNVAYTRHDLSMNERVGTWTRPFNKVLYLLGFGEYLGDELINGEPCPVVRFDNGKEMVLHYAKVAYGRENGIKLIAEKFEGTVVEVDLEAFLKPGFEHPVRPPEEDEAVPSRRDQTPPAGTRKAEPETVFDVLSRLSREAALERNKVTLFQDHILVAEERLRTIAQEMALVKEKATAEIEKLSLVAPVKETTDA